MKIENLKSEEVAVYSIDPVELIAGSLPRRQRRLVEAWAEVPQTELLAAWQRLQEGRLPQPIDPLKEENRMRHPIYRVRSFEKLSPYTLRICFDDDIEQTIDFRSILSGELYGPLRDPEMFDQVHIDPEVHTLVWPNGADFDPATLHDWPQHREVFMARAQQWESVSERERKSA